MNIDLLGLSSTPAGPPVLTVSQLNARAKGLLEEEYAEVLVEGEISSWRTYPSGHSYYDLKDAKAKVAAVMFSGRKRFLRFRPEDGMRVLVRCRVTLYERAGRFQLSVLSMDPLGEGALEVAFRQLHQRLEKEGLFEPSRKQEIPARPLRVALVTSREGAALRDMLRVLQDRAPIVEVVLVHTLVQGEKAVTSISEAIRRADEVLPRLGRPADLIIVGRGGGSREDLWAFNEEALVRTVSECSTPVLSAVGHEVDVSLCDLAADETAPTPTAAVERVARGWKAASDELSRLPAYLLRLIRGRISALADQYTSIVRERVFRFPHERIEAMGQRVDILFDRMRREAREAERRRIGRLDSALPRLTAASPRGRIRTKTKSIAERANRMTIAGNRAIERKDTHISAAVGRLHAVSPLAVLARGYSLTYRLLDGKLLQRASGVSVGEGVRVKLMEGGLMCRIEEVLDDGEGR